VDNLPSSQERDFKAHAIEMPPGFEVYCIYFPTGMDEEYETKMIDTLRVWGSKLGKNVYVAHWDTRDSSYGELSKQIGLDSVPAIILTDTDKPHSKSLLIKIVDRRVVNNMEKIKTLLPNLAQLILVKENHDDIVKYMNDMNKEMTIAKMKAALGNVRNVKAKVQISLGGIFAVEFDNR
jgi:hypothetical protein